jgi:hypothetical protein
MTDLQLREAGNALDADLCRALGWASVIGDEEVFWRTEHGETVGRTEPPALSSDIALAFQVVGAMRERCPGWDWQINVSSNGAAVRCCYLGETPWTLINPRKATGLAALSLAICLAALKALDASPSPQQPLEPSPAATPQEAE